MPVTTNTISVIFTQEELEYLADVDCSKCGALAGWPCSDGLWKNPSIHIERKVRALNSPPHVRSIRSKAQIALLQLRRKNNEQ